MGSAEIEIVRTLKDICKELHEMNKKLDRLYKVNNKPLYSPDKRIVNTISDKKENDDEISN